MTTCHIGEKQSVTVEIIMGWIFREAVQQVYHKTEHIQGRDILPAGKITLCPQSHNPLTKGGVMFM